MSNFQPPHLRRLIDETGVTPSVNQIELHPRFQQAGLRREHEDLGIATEAWSPLAQGQVLDDPTITGIAEAHDRTPGQVVIRWHLQIDNIVFPKSATPTRIEENFNVFDFHLSETRWQRSRSSTPATGPAPTRILSSARSPSRRVAGQLGVVVVSPSPLGY